MIWAEVSGKKVRASPQAKGKCPCCKGDVIAKCGQLVSWHWAHASKDCDSWGEPESDWHIGWKSLFPEECQEVTRGSHRADVSTRRGVIEFQKSYLSYEDIQTREQHYGNMVWVVEASDFDLEPFLRWHETTAESRWVDKLENEGMVDHSGLLDERDSYINTLSASLQEREPHFVWRWAAVRWIDAEKPVLLDTGGEALFRLVKTYEYNKRPTVIKCKAVSKKDFVSYFTAA